MANVTEILEQANLIYKERNKEYGDTYKIHGEVIAALFPNGIHLDRDIHHIKFGVLTMIVSKLTRLCQNFHMGHDDSLLDLVTYSAMLKEIYEADDKDLS